MWYINFFSILFLKIFDKMIEKSLTGIYYITLKVPSTEDFWRFWPLPDPPTKPKVPFFEGFPNDFDKMIFYALILRSSDKSIRTINLICCELTWKFIDSNQQTCIKYDNNFVDPLLELSISTAHVWNPILSLTTATCVSP